MNKAIFPALIALSLSACSGDIETRITSAGETSTNRTSYLIDNGDVLISNELKQAQQLVGARLQSAGFTQSDIGQLHLEVTLSTRPAALALFDGKGAAIQTLSAAKHKKPLQSCDDVEYRLGVALTRLSDGVEIYRANAAEYHCHATLAEATPMLVDAALVDLGAPKGSYLVKHKGKD
jgi:hypothetical protein